MRRVTQLALTLVGLSGLLLACTTTPARDVSTHAGQESLSLLLPKKIEIVEPFTRASRFGGDAGDGIELLLRAVNSLGNPGLMIVGDIRIELYQYVPASADHKGTRIDGWDIPLRTEADQRDYWNRLTQMYEFHLQVNAASLPQSGRFVLQVTYLSPLGEHLTDEMVLAVSSSRRSGRPAVRR